MTSDFFSELVANVDSERLLNRRRENKEMIDRLGFENRYIDAELGRRSGAGPAQSKNAPTRKVGTRRQNKNDAIKTVMRTDATAAWVPAVVRDRLAAEGIDATKDAIRVAMGRMADAGELVRDVTARGAFRLPDEQLAASNGAATSSNREAVQR